MKNFLKWFLTASVWILLYSSTHAQEVVINEYYNSAGQNDEWTELVVVKDNLDLSGWFIGDNNAATSNWQPKIRFKNVPLWKNLRAGTIIQIDHAANVGGCDDPTDVDKSDGFIRVCCRNTLYFEGGSSTTLFLADDGDFVHIINPSGKMEHGIGHDDQPGTSVEGGSCFNSSPLWTQTTSPQAATRPCGNFLYYRFRTSAPTSLYVSAGETANFFAGMQTQPGNGFLDTSDVPFEGIGNAGLNASWVVEQRKPPFQAQNVCQQKAENGTITISWQAGTDVFPGDLTTGYLVIRNQTGDFPSPTQGIEYSLNQNLGNGAQQSKVVGILIGSQNTTFSENPGLGTFYYRIFPFRYKNTSGFQHFTRGRTYNTESFVKVLNESLPPYTIKNDTLCQPGLAKLIFHLEGAIINWFANPVGGQPILTGKDTLVQFINSNTSFWVSPVGVSTCFNERIEVKAFVLPAFSVNLISSDSVCEGTQGFMFVPQNPNWTYSWSLLNPPPGLTTTRLDSHYIGFNVPYYPERRFFGVRCIVTNEKGCQAPTIERALVTVPFNPQLVASNPNPIENEQITVSISPSFIPAFCNQWLVNGGNLQQQNRLNCVVSTADSMVISGYIESVLPNDAPFCKVYRTLKIATIPPPAPLLPIPNFVSLNGDKKNDFLDFDRREVLDFKVFNRWGKEIFSSKEAKPKWPGTNVAEGIYFFEVRFFNPNLKTEEREMGWVMVGRE